jgi:hypothetical protein
MTDFLTIPGEQVTDMLNEAATYDDLFNNITQEFPETRKRQHATNEVNVREIRYIPVRTTAEGGALQLASTTTSNSHTYKQQLLFSDVHFAEEDAEDNITFRATDGQEYHVQPITMDGNRIRVNCNCMDFHMRFALWNFNNDTLMGRKPPPYRRKTDNRPPVNPGQVDGMCKHLIKVCDQLRQQGLISG